MLLEAGPSTEIDAKEIRGLVLIDEIDLHLHPRWQARLVTPLKAAFPKVQFVVTTHSPMVLPALTAEEVVLLDQPAERWPVHARALELASEWMAEAAVSTIHAWCKRMLVEHAFDSGSLFTQTLETDQREQLAEVVRDYWRSFMLPLATAEAAEVAQWWPAPEPLGEAAGKLLAHLDALPAADEPAVELGRSLTARAAALAALKSPWGAWADSLQALLDDPVAAKAVDGRVIQPRRYQPWFDALRSWAADPAALLPALTDTALSRLTPEGLAAGWKSGTPPDHPALVALAELTGRIAALPDARAAVTVHGARWIRWCASPSTAPTRGC